MTYWICFVLLNYKELCDIVKLPLSNRSLANEFLGSEHTTFTFFSFYEMKKTLLIYNWTMTIYESNEKEWKSNNQFCYWDECFTEVMSLKLHSFIPMFHPSHPTHKTISQAISQMSVKKMIKWKMNLFFFYFFFAPLRLRLCLKTICKFGYASAAVCFMVVFVSSSSSSITFRLIYWFHLSMK